MRAAWRLRPRAIQKRSTEKIPCFVEEACDLSTTEERQRIVKACGIAPYTSFYKKKDAAYCMPRLVRRRR
jgi:hypothetical protein